MANASLGKKLIVGYLAFVALFFTCVLSWLFPNVTHRVPTEIPLGALLQAQQEALGPNWTLRSSNNEIFTDSDFTSGSWIYLTVFDHADYHFNAALEFHTFQSPYLAERSLSPSPRAVNVRKRGNTPDGWRYIPPHADRFVLDCRPRAVPEYCYVLLVYQEYSMVYATDLADAMTLEELQRMLQATDGFMTDFLDNTTLVKGRRSIPTLPELGIQLDG